MLAFVEFDRLDLWVNLAVFTASVAAVWCAGVRLSRYADVVADRTGLGEAFTGLLLLGGATSLPELVTALSAAWGGAGEMAASNLLGGVAMQTAVLAVADLFIVRGALTFFTPRAVLLVHAIVLIALLALVVVGAATGETVTIAHVGLGTLVIAGTYLGGLRIAQTYERQPAWEPVDPPDERAEEARVRAHVRAMYAGTSATGLALRLVALLAVVTVAGWTVAKTAEAISWQTGLAAGFVGATFVAVSTSLPELSTTIAAVRLGAYSMAVSNVFGGNAIDVALLGPADLALGEGPILASLDSGALFLTGLGILLTCIYVWGLLEREDRSILRLGFDSAAVIVLYAGGLVIHYLLTRGGDG